MKVISRSDGVVSLLTTIMISLLLVILTTSLISLETLQLRKSEDSEQSLRAYYAAEAGIEDAAAKVLNKTITDTTPSCLQNLSYADASGQVGWTCQQVLFTGTPSGELKNPDEAQTVDATGTNFRLLVLEWDQSNATAAQLNASAAVTAGGLAGAWPYVAPIELTIVRYPSGGFTAAQVGTDVKLQNAVFYPAGPGAQAAVPYTAGPAGGLANGGPYPATCVAGGALPGSKYNCYRAIDFAAAPGYDYLFRIRSRYAGTSYQLSFHAGAAINSAIKPVNSGSEYLDVTAKAGDATRRVISRLPAQGGAASGLNYVIYSDTDICKNFNVLVNIAQPPGPVTGC